MKDEIKLNKSKIANLANFIRDNVDKLYTKTHFSSTSNMRDLTSLNTSINSTLDKITDGNVTTNGDSNISQLYSRCTNSELSENLDLEELFSDAGMSQGILSNFGQNKYLRDYDQEIDLICKYMPTLEDALDAKKDNVLSADHFSKDYISATNINAINQNQFDNRIDNIKEKYKLLELLEESYSNTAKYGEQFIYIIPYKKALSRLLKNKNATNNSTLNESFDLASFKDFKDKFEINNKNFEFNVTLNRCGVIESIVSKYDTINYVNEATSFDKIIDDELKFEGIDKSSSIQDGFVDLNKKNKDLNIKVPGCIVKRLRRENVIPLYVEDICLGYYYIESDNPEILNSMTTSIAGDPMMSISQNRMGMESQLNQKDQILKGLSAKLSEFIDDKFINTNQDLSSEIYTILKYNEFFNMNGTNNIKITYISPEDMVHMYFKRDPITHRGISDLHNSIITAKLYICLYASNTLGMLTRGHDKRVYYVKQSVDSNIAKTLLNTINQIKKSNFGTREFNNIRNVLNITGKYNDYVIPVGPSGDPPIQFEVLPGQQIDSNQELLELLEQLAINGTDVPYEYIQSRKSVDFAVRLTMSSGKFLRKVYKRQSQVEIFFSKILNKIYQAEYECDDKIDFKLPAPSFLNILNNNQMFENINQYAEVATEIVLPNDEDTQLVDKVKSKIKKHQLASYVDFKMIDKFIHDSKMELERDRTGSEQ